MFSSFPNLDVLYRTLSLSEHERKELERNLISLLDPPFNWQHRARPRTKPIIGRGRVARARSPPDLDRDARLSETEALGGHYERYI